MAPEPEAVDELRIGRARLAMLGLGALLLAAALILLSGVEPEAVNRRELRGVRGGAARGP